MSNYRRFLLPLLALVCSSSVIAANLEVQAEGLRDRAMKGDNVAYDVVRELTTRIGPRPAGSPSERAAAEWAAGKLRDYGFTSVRIESFPVTAWVRGDERVEMIAPRPQPMVAIGLGGSPGTVPEGVEGEVAVFESLDALSKVPSGALDGKIAMINQPMQRTRDGAGYLAAVKGRSAGPTEAAARGAVGFLIRSLGTDNHRFAHAGSTRYRDESVAIPSFAVSVPDADQIARLVGMGEKIRIRLRSGAHYVRTGQSQNVIGEIKGRSRPDEIVLLGAHLDSWDQGTGAIDDGAGVAIVTAAAKLVGDLPRHPKRTIRVVLYGAEEVSQPKDGGTGGQAYRDAHADTLEKHQLAMESDFGTARIYAAAFWPGVAETPFGAAAMRVLSPLSITPWPESAKRGGSDVQPLLEAGVPVFALRQDGTNYFDIHHTPDDTLDKIDGKALDQNVAAWAAIAWMAAETDMDFRTPVGKRP